MKVHLIRKQTIEEYIHQYPGSRASFRNWLNILKYADWENPEHLLETFSSADLLGNGSNKVVFNIAGNRHRMICHYIFGEKQVHLFICWIGTHSEYTDICKMRKQYTINIY